MSDPVDVGSGNVWEHITDYTTSGQNRLDFKRFYNSEASVQVLATFAQSMGVNWRHNFDRYLSLSPYSIIAERADGQQITFTGAQSNWTPDTDVDLTLTQSGSSWTLVDHNDTEETYTTLNDNEAILQSIKARNGFTETMHYNENNQLVSVSDSFGRELGLVYQGGLLSKVVTPDGTILSYGYTPSGAWENLTSVSYSTIPPTSTQYQYSDENFPFALTAIIDENGSRFAEWAYDAVGRATFSQLANGANATNFTYNDDGSTSVTTSAGVADTYYFEGMQGGLLKVVKINRAYTPTTQKASTVTAYKGNQSRYLSGTISGCIAEV